MMKKVFLIICFAMILLSTHSIDAQVKTYNAMPKQSFPIGEKRSESSAKAVTTSVDTMLVRISEIEVYPQYLDEYLQYAYTVGSTSVKEEPGVVCIYPMQTKRDACQIRILEIYASQKAYQHHIKTSHFQKYKTETLHMVKSLDLVDMNALDPATMPQIFLKWNK